jgi:hypothetical protein
MIRETCSCGATFEASGFRYSSGEEYAATTWREKHKCVEPVTMLLEETDSGPGLADVIERLTTISEHVAFIGRLLRTRSS